MNIKYDLSAVEILNILGYRQPTGKNWLEKIEQKKILNCLRFTLIL